MSWAVLGAAAAGTAWLACPLLAPVGHALQQLAAWIAAYLCVGAAASVVIGGLFGPKAGKAVGNLWIASLRLAASLMTAAARRLVRRRER